MLAVDVERSTADELARLGFDDGEGANVGAYLFVRAMEEGAVEGEAFDELVNGAGVVRLRLTRLQGCRFKVVFRWDEGDCVWGGKRKGRWFLYERQCHRHCVFSSFRLITAGMVLVEVECLGGSASDELAAVMAAFVGRLPGDGCKGALEEGVVHDIALVVFALDDPVARIGLALTAVSKDQGGVEALRCVALTRSGLRVRNVFIEAIS